MPREGKIHSPLSGSRRRFPKSPARRLRTESATCNRRARKVCLVLLKTSTLPSSLDMNSPPPAYGGLISEAELAGHLLLAALDKDEQHHDEKHTSNDSDQRNIVH